LKKILKYQTQLSLTIKIIIVASALYYLFYQFDNKDLNNIYEELTNSLNYRNSKLYLFIVLLLFPINWGLEIIKWKLLIKKVEDISYSLAIKCVLSGVAVSLFTPNRIGEFGGRIFHLKKADRVKSILISLFSNYSKIIVIILFGSISFIVLPFIIEENIISKTSYIFYLLLFIILFFNLFIFSIYFGSSHLSNILKKSKIFKKYNQYLNVFNQYSKKELLIILILSALRYLTFSLQFYFILKVFNVTTSLISGLSIISLTFFINSIIPNFILTEPIVRGQIANSLFSLLNLNMLNNVTTASFVLWIINLALPAIVGLFFVFDMNFFRKKNKNIEKNLQ